MMELSEMKANLAYWQTRVNEAVDNDNDKSPDVNYVDGGKVVHDNIQEMLTHLEPIISSWQTDHLTFSDDVNRHDARVQLKRLYRSYHIHRLSPIITNVIYKTNKYDVPHAVRSMVLESNYVDLEILRLIDELDDFYDEKDDEK